MFYVEKKIKFKNSGHEDFSRFSFIVLMTQNVLEINESVDLQKKRRQLA